MAPVLKRLAEAGLEPRVCVTAQHRDMLDQVLKLFDITPDIDLNLMRPDQSLDALTASALTGITEVLQAERPQMVLVHGDTTTALSAALAAFYRHIPVGHVEAGLRTGNIAAPFPEEVNRRLADTVSSLHFAPTESARYNLLFEGIQTSTISITGNTVIDALFMVREKLLADAEQMLALDREFPFPTNGRRLVLVTGHRRENFGPGFEDICAALGDLSNREDIEIVYPVHLNPNVQKPVLKMLSNLDNVHLIEPVDYRRFVYLMMKACIVITDSGGVQEEAPSLGKPVLVMRDVTERPEAVEAGTVRLVGTERLRIEAEANRLLDDPVAYEEMSRAHNPYGDGHAAERIVKRIQQYAG